ncbi:MAG: hypothetical protein LQ339_008771 [Xanthoria mediterranea]|nr:MAG: hypothetical protein LQ339_008771 [Xanthoria mediterranea]
MDDAAASLARPTDQVLTEIARYVYRYEIKSPLAMERARTALLDALGCAMETLSSGDRPSFIGPFVQGCKTQNGFRLPGTVFDLDPVKGAFDMAVLIRYLDHNDAFTGAEWGHPSGRNRACVIRVSSNNIVSDNIGSILAVADWLSRNPAETSDNTPPLTIQTVLIALVKAYEIQGCFQISNAFNSVGLDHVILVKVASAAVISWLLGLSESQAVDAISQAWMDGHPLRVYRHGQNTGPRKGWAGGDACMRAVQLALLTRSGQPGALTVLSAPRWGFYDAIFRGKTFNLPRSFNTWVVENTLFKLTPAEAHSLTAMEAMLKLERILKEQAVDLHNDIGRITVRTHAAACLIIDKSGPLENAADRDHCMQYILAVTLLKGAQPDSRDFSDASPWASDPRVDYLREKIEIFECEQYTLDYLNEEKRSLASALTVVFANGNRTEEVAVEYPLGSPKHPGTKKAVEAKICRNLGLIFSREEVEQIVATVATKAKTTMVHDLVDTLWRGNSS